MKKCLLALSISIFIFILYFSHKSASLTQFSFVFDLNNSIFNFTEHQLNDSSSSKSLVFTGNQDLTIWVRIPKNSTIIDGKIYFQGIMNPIQSSTSEQVYSLAIGNANLTNPWDEIAVGTSGDSYIKLLNSSGNLIWSYSTNGDVYGVDIGNLSSDVGNEIVGVSSGGYIYFLNVSGNKKWDLSLGNTIYDVDVGNVNLTNEWDEIAIAAGDNKVYLFDNNGNQLWSYAGSGSFMGVGIGNLSFDEGNEIAAGSGNYVYLLNASGHEKWNSYIGTMINDVDVGDVISNELDEIAIAGNNGTVFLLNATGDVLWSYTTTSGQKVDTVSIGEVTSECDGGEIVVGSYDNKIYVLNSTGGLVWSYTTENDVRGVGIGNLTIDSGNEVAAGTNIPATYTLYILNFEYYPTNAYLDIGNDSDTEWQYPGKFRTSDSVSNSNEFQDFLATCEADSSGRCDVPLVFHSDFSGVLNVSQINVNYTYNISNLVSYVTVDFWSRTNNVKVNESIGSKVKNITYIKNPAYEIQVRYIVVDNSANSCDFNGTQYSITTIGGRKVCDVSSSSRIIPSSGYLGYDWIWDNTMESEIAVYMNESSPISEYGYWKKNLTVWNVTPTIFTNVIANTSLDEDIITGNSKLYVDWYSNGTLYDITPSSSQNNCNSNPTYTKITVGGDSFYVCKQDTNSNGLIDFFIWKQPNTNKSFTVYQVSGSANNPARIKDVNITPEIAFWGNEISISVNATDLEGNNVTVMPCINLTHTFDIQSINISAAVWNCSQEKNTTENSASGQILIFNFTTDYSWTGINLLTFKFRDFEDDVIYHDWDYTTVSYGPNITKRDATVSLIKGNETSVNRTESVFLLIQVNDTVNNQPISNAKCGFWVSLNDTNWSGVYITESNSSGYCNYTFTPDSSYSTGLRWWKGGIYNDSYYNNVNSSNFSVYVYGKISVNITQDTYSRNITRNYANLLKGNIFDEFGRNLTISGYNCSFYLNESFIGSSLTNSNGICEYSFYPSCSYGLGLYNLKVNISENINPYYLHNKTSDTRNIFLKENLTLSIVSPLSTQIFHKGESMQLNSTIQDSCGQPQYSYNFTWKLNCTTEEGGPPPLYTTKKGDNVTWDVECFPGILKIIAEAGGELYNLGSKNTSVDIYGWSDVSFVSPSNGTYNRTWNNRVVNISCIVKDANSTSILDGYTVDILEKFGSGEYTKLATKTTDPNGFANYTWNISSNDTVPEGWHTIKCNITDQVLNPLKKYNASTSETTVNILIIETDTTPPTIEWYNATSVLYGNNGSIEANVTDWYGVKNVWVNLTYPNRTSYIFYLENTTADIRQSLWRVNLTGISLIGDYDFVLYANDTTFTSYATDWFEVYQPIQMYVSSNYPIKYTLYRPGSDLIVHQFSNNSGSNYNYTIHKRNYDFLAKIEDAYSQTHFVKFNDMNSTLTSEKQFGTASNITNPINLSIISLSLLEPPIPWRHELAALYITSNMSYSNVTISLNYSNKYDETDYEPGIVMYKCDVWLSNSCNSSWTVVSSTLDLTNHIISTTQNSTSVYYAFEPEVCGNSICGSGESCYNCPTDCGECGSGQESNPPSSGGGSSGGYQAYCGNGICDSDESALTCLQDCGNVFTIRTNLTQDYVKIGANKKYAIWITNRLDKNLGVSIYITGPISAFLNIKEKNISIKPSEEKEIIVESKIPENIEVGAYTGELVVSGGNKIERLPIALFVSSKTPELYATVKAVTKSVKANDTAVFEVSFYSTSGKKDFDVKIEYLIKNLDDNKIIYKEYEKIPIKVPYQFLKKVLISENVSAGKYTFAINVTYDSENIIATDTFDVTRSVLTARAIRIGMIGLSVILFVALAVFGWKKYVSWKLSKTRYIFPVDFNLLPKGDLWLGKIAETQVKATFDRKDLTTHILVAGATGAGKSVSASIFAEELLMKKIPVVVFDPTAQWTGFVRQCKDENVLKYYGKHGLRIDDARSFPGNIYEMTDPKIKIEFKKYMNPGEITVFVLKSLEPGQYDEAVTNIINSIFKESWEESTEPKLIIVFDEVHRLLEKYGGKGGYVALERACREFRKWGIGLIMVSQVLSDFKEAVKGNVLTEIQLHTKSLSDLQRVEKKYGLEYARRVAKEEVGIGMIQNPKYNKGLPWFVSFRPPLHMPHKILDSELEMYKQYNSRIEKIEQEIERIEASGKDVFDLKIEIRLAKDKLKRGMFRVAEIYIESLNKKLGIEK